MYQFLIQNCELQLSIPEETLYCIRYHSFYPWHQHNEYEYLSNDKDIQMLPILKLFQSCDLYSKSIIVDSEKLKDQLSYYERLWEKYIGPLDKLYNI